MGTQLTDEERQGLSPEEIEAIEADDDGSDLLSAVASDDEDDDGDEGAAPADDKKEAPSSEDNGDVDDEPAPEPLLAPAVENYDERVKALKAEKAEAFKKFSEGDMTSEDYMAIEDRVSTDLADLHYTQREHEASIRRAQQQAKADWDAECRRFMRDTLKREQVDYGNNPILGAALDTAVKALANDPKNESKPADWFLEEAHKQVKAAMGIKAAPSPAPAASSRKADLSGIPPAIGKLPVAMDAPVNGDEFAHMRNLRGSDYEKAIAAMTPEQLDRFMGS